jgi:tRNA threonylcarbamoyladenosine biosynthesis protein TsaB
MLAIETASPDISVALHDGERVIASVGLSIGSRHAEAILPAVEHLMMQTGRSLNDVTHVGIDRGPGLFTGLRVGLSTARSLSFALGVPVVAVSSLEALAFADGRVGETVITVLDARRREVYVAAYTRTTAGLKCVVSPFVASAATAVEQLVAERQSGVLSQSAVLIGDGCETGDGVLLSVGTVVARNRPHADAVASFAVAQLQANSAVTEPFELLYLRAPDAEITWDNRHGPAPR